MVAIRKREEELAYPRSKNGKEKGIQTVTRGVLRPVTVPHADGSWHPIAKRMYDSLRTSGQADFFQNSDWQFAWMLCEELSVYKTNTRRSSQMFASLLMGFERLLLTEADRRKARIELHEVEIEQVSAQLIAIDGYKKALGASGPSASA